MEQIKQVRTENQLTTAYAAYEVIGQYFKKAKFHNQLEEGKQTLLFRLLSEKKQVALEEKFDKYLEEHPLPVNIADLQCDVFTEINKEFYIITFNSYFTEISVSINHRGYFRITVTGDLS